MSTGEPPVSRGGEPLPMPLSTPTPSPGSVAPVDGADESLLLGGTTSTDPTAANLGNWQLVWRRFRRNLVGLLGAAGVLMLLTMTLFASFFSPYSPIARNGQAVYRPPQMPRFVHPEVGLRWRPFVHPVVTVFDEET